MLYLFVKSVELLKTRLLDVIGGLLMKASQHYVQNAMMENGMDILRKNISVN